LALGQYTIDTQTDHDCYPYRIEEIGSFLARYHYYIKYTHVSVLAYARGSEAMLSVDIVYTAGS